MNDPSLALQKAITDALKADPAVAGFVGDRVFDRVPVAAARPYLRVADDEVHPDRAECLDGSVEIFVNVHAWSDKPGRVEAKRIGGAVVAALDGADLDLGPDHALVLIEHRLTRYLDDPDGLLAHAVVSLRVLADAA